MHLYIYRQLSKILLIIALIVVLPLPAMAVEADDSKSQPVLSFGVVPQQAASKITRLWSPIIHWLSKRSGHEIKLVTAKNIPEFEKQLAKGTYDFAYMNPYHFTVYNESPGYQAVARQRGKRIHGILVARKDSSIKGFEDLQGQKLSFPSPAAFAASILPRASLKKSGIDFTPVYVSSHDSEPVNFLPIRLTLIKYTPVTGKNLFSLQYNFERCLTVLPNKNC